MFGFRVGFVSASFCFLFHFETRCYSVAQASLELITYPRLAFSHLGDVGDFGGELEEGHKGQ